MRRLIILLSVLILAAPLMFWGCTGSDGTNGLPGAPGSAGPAGAAGGAGAPGGAVDPSGLAPQDSAQCVLCHGKGKLYDVAKMHNLDPVTGNVIKAGTINANITAVTFGAPVGDNVPVTVTFTFQALDESGGDITSKINLLDNNPTNQTQLLYTRFSVAKLVAGTVYPSGNQGTNEWYDYVNNQRVNGQLSLTSAAGVSPAVYTYRFPTSGNNQGVTVSGAGSVSTGNTIPVPYANNATTRAAIQLSGFSLALFTSNTTLQAPVANPTFDLVPNGTAIVTTKDDVTTAACNKCHFRMSAHGSRIETKFCVVCHNPTLPGIDCTVTGLLTGELNFSSLVHRIHGDNTLTNKVLAIDNPATTQNERLDFNYITYPPESLGGGGVLNCTMCHKGANDYWKTRPSRESCGTCHTSVNFATGAGHSVANISQADDSQCAGCHPPSGPGLSITNKMATANITPDNPQLPIAVTGGQLKAFQYGIDNVTVDAANQPVVTFWIRWATADANGIIPPPGPPTSPPVAPWTYLNLFTDNTGLIKAPAGFTGSPAFLAAFYAPAPNDNVAGKADYNNFGALGALPATTSGRNGQPQSINIVNLAATSTDNAHFVATLPAGTFPVGATMRAIGLQGYFTQSNVDLGNVPLDNVGRHTPAAMKNVTGDAIRRVVVKSGYNATTGQPEGCLECHQIIEGHGGNRVNNVQVCVMCHNPNMTTSGRTLGPVPPSPPIIASIQALYGNTPLQYPEVTDNLRELIHGFHASGDDPSVDPIEFARVNPYIDIRNRVEVPGTIGVLLNGSDVTYPGALFQCTKCHVGETYKADLPVNLLNTTEKIQQNLAPADNAAVIADRNTVPNLNDLVNSPTASACGYCHDTNTTVSHMMLNGGIIKQTRGALPPPPPPLAPVVLPSP